MSHRCLLIYGLGIRSTTLSTVSALKYSWRTLKLLMYSCSSFVFHLTRFDRVPIAPRNDHHSCELVKGVSHPGEAFYLGTSFPWIDSTQHLREKKKKRKIDSKRNVRRSYLCTNLRFSCNLLPGLCWSIGEYHFDWDCLQWHWCDKRWQRPSATKSKMNERMSNSDEDTCSTSVKKRKWNEASSSLHHLPSLQWQCIE